MKQLKQLLLVMAIALTGFTPAQAQTPTFNHYSEWMAYARRNMVYTKKTPPYSDQDKYDGTHEVDWWRYDDGLMYESILDTYEYYKTRGGVHGSELLSGVQRYLNKSITGSSSSPSITNFAGGELDDMRPGRLVWKYCYTYDHSEDSKIDVYKAACAKVINANAFQDDFRVGYSDGHKDFPWQHKDNYTQQVWLDGIFMGIPYWTLAGPQIGSSQKSDWGTNATKFFDDAVRQMQVTDSTTFVPTTGLWCHAWDYTKTKTWADCSNLSLNYPHITAETTSGNNTGRSLHTWGRALGWYAMAIMETMDNITAVDANYAKLKDMKDLFKKVMDAVISYRDETSGVWYCVLDVGDNTSATSPYNPDNYPVDKKPKRNNYLEATCSSMFAYCLLHGVAKGYLDNSYLETAKDAYKKVVNKFITTSGDEIHLNNCMQVGGLDSSRDGSFAYYMSEPVIQDDSKGVGPFIWASLEAEKIGYNMETKSFDPIDENTIVTFAWSKASDEITNGDSYTSPTFTARSYGNDTPLTNSSEIVFESSNPSVATVDNDGTVTPIGVGTATITAALKEGSTYTWSGTNPSYTITVNAPDTTAPTLEDQSITNGATNVSTSGSIVLTFSEDVGCTTNATLTTTGSSAISLTPTVSGTTVTYSYSGLTNNTSYTFNLPANSVADLSGNNYTSAINIEFTTGEEATSGLSAVSNVTWNASNFSTESHTNITIENNLEIAGSTASNKSVSIETNSEKSQDGITFTKHFKLAGGGSATNYCYLHFKAFGNSKITVYGSSSGSTSRTLNLSVGSFGNSVQNLFTSNSTDVSKGTYNYEGNSAQDFYVYSNSGGMYVYGIKVESLSPTPSTYTLTNTVNTEGYGTVSPATVANIPSGTATSSSTNTYTVNGTTVTATPATATAEYTYAFSGWSGLPATVTADATVTANFTRTAKSYTLAWNKNAEDADDLTGNYTNGSTAYGTTLTPPSTPTRSGYTFNGWNSAQDGKGTALGETMPAANTTYYAQWTENTPVVEQVATPSITGTTPFSSSTSVTMSCTTTGATIHYTTDGSTPTASSTTYSSPIAISATTTIKAIAIKSGMTDSEVASATFTKSGGGGGGSGTVLFSQYFNDATEVAYAADNTARTITTDSGNNIVGTNSKTQFSYIGMTAKSGAGIAINSTTGGNSVNATGFFQAYCNATGQNWALVHNTDFADTAPTALKIDMKIYFQQLSSGSDYSVSFAVGDNFENGTSSPTSANVHSGFSILNNSTAKLSQYLTKTVIYDTGITQGSWQDVTWIINNNGEVLTYTDPKGKSSTVNNDCFDLWIGTTKVATNQAATTAATALQNLYIGDPAGKKNEFRLDEIVVTDLSPAAMRTTTATIKAGKQYATFNTTMDIDFDETDGLQAFVVDNATKSSVHLTEVTVVPANTALIIKGAPNTYTLYETKKATESVSDNQLIISNSTVAADNMYYALGTVNGVQGFHRVQNGLTIPTSYVIITDQTAKAFLNFEEEENIATGIDGFATDNGFIVIDDNTPLYNLSGQRVSKDYKGIVIVNGKKVLRK